MKTKLLKKIRKRYSVNMVTNMPPENDWYYYFVQNGRVLFFIEGIAFAPPVTTKEHALNKILMHIRDNYTYKRRKSSWVEKKVWYNG